MTKLIIQIPCYNEEKTLGESLDALPRSIPGIDVIEYLIIDDGSHDATVEVAKAHGAHHVVNLPENRGLARGFIAGLRACIAHGADIIVNTDADNQYQADDIAALVKPILDGRAEIVVGERPIADNPNFGSAKKALQKLGSAAVRFFSKTTVPDAPSGFRAFSRSAAMQMHVFNEYTYTLETIIQAGQKGMAITSVPIRVNKQTRPSRLVSSIPDYIRRCVLTMLRIFIVYRPLQFFSTLAVLTFLPGFLLGMRFLFLYAVGHGDGHIQSVILAALLMGIGAFLFVVALIADLIAANRNLLENISFNLHRLEDRVIQIEQARQPQTSATETDHAQTPSHSA